MAAMPRALEASDPPRLSALRIDKLVRIFPEE
ncbi:hypothetical protein NAEX_08816 [Nannocystis exedens]|nr:hypothetical protein NAEX_08816 [Nannocystis exedens]